MMGFFGLSEGFLRDFFDMSAQLGTFTTKKVTKKVVTMSSDGGEFACLKCGVLNCDVEFESETVDGKNVERLLVECPRCGATRIEVPLDQREKKT